MELAPIVSGITPSLGDALSMDRRWWPQRDSNPCFSHGHVFASSIAMFSIVHPVE
jgi:hypothetical protein